MRPLLRFLHGGERGIKKRALYVPQTNQLREIYLFREAKRLRAAEIELEHLARYKEALRTNVDSSLLISPSSTRRLTRENAFIDVSENRTATVPIFGAAEYVDSRRRLQRRRESQAQPRAQPRRDILELTPYPYATPNSHWKYLDETSPKAVVDGAAQQDAPCWKPNRRTDLC